MNYSDSQVSYQLSGSFENMCLSGNGQQSITSSQCSSKSHSATGSLTSNMTIKQERSTASLSESESTDSEIAKVGINECFDPKLVGTVPENQWWGSVGP